VWLCALVLLVGCEGEGGADARVALPPGRPRLGINLNRASHYTPEWVFVDAFKLSRDASSSKNGGFPWQLADPDERGAPELDPEGYPLGLAAGQRVSAICLRGLAGHYPPGTYTVIFEGDGEVGTKLDAERKSLSHDGQGEARFEVAVIPSDDGIEVRILRSNPSNHVRNVRLVMPGFADSYEEQPFHPLFLERLRPFQVIRYMDWGKTNDSPLRVWSERRLPDARTQDPDRAGIAYEHMLALSNTLQAEPWICVPHLADDDHVRALARLVRDQLDPSLEVWVEYSNEVWNGQFGQHQDVKAAGAEQGRGWQEQYALRSKEIFALFAAELGGRDRLVRVVATQLAAADTVTRPIMAHVGAGEADVLAVAAYVGGHLGGADAWERTREMTPEQVIEATLADVARRREWLRATRRVAKGLPVVAYEGGQHLVGTTKAAKADAALNEVLDAANRHPRMAAVYEALFDMWAAEGGDLFCCFNYAYEPSKHGRWGLLEYQDQPLESAPKYRAAAARARLWAERGRQD
jgi:hypothetical protein